jgi:hypothetical protein
MGVEKVQKELYLPRRNEGVPHMMTMTILSPLLKKLKKKILTWTFVTLLPLYVQSEV